jgi:hypothetical protein
MSEENKFILDVEIAPLKAQLKDAAADLQGARQKFGEFSDEAITAAKKVAAIKDEIEGAAEQAQLFDPGKKFMALGSLATQAAGGLAAVQGAMALIGSESEDVNKALLKVQGALALSQGLSELKDIGKSFGFIKTGIAAATQGMNGFKKALLASGIGALVVAVGTLVAYWDDIKGLVSGVSSEQEKLNEKAKANVTAQQEKLDALNSSDEILKAEGKSEEEILQLKMKQTEQVIAAQEEQIKQAKITKDAQVAAAKRNAEITKQIVRGGMEISTAGLRLLAAPIDAVLAVVNKVSSALGFGDVVTFSLNEQISNLNESVSEFAGNKLFDPKGVEEEGDKSIKEMETTLLNSKNKFAGYQNQLKGISEKKTKERNEAEQKIDDEFRKKREEADKVFYDRKKSLETQQRQEELALEEKYLQDKKTLIAGGYTDLSVLEDSYKKEQQALSDKYRKEEEDRVAEYENKLKEIKDQIRFSQMEEGFEKEREMIRANYAAQIDEVLKNEKLKEDEKNNLIAALEEQRNLELAQKEEEKAVADYEKKIAEQDRILAENQGRLDIEKQVLDEKQKMTDEAFAAGLLSEEQYNAKMFEYSQQRKAIAETEVENRRAVNAALLGLAGQFGQTLSAIAGKNKKVAIAGVVIEQAAAIGQIIANTAIANAKAVKTSPTTFGLPWVAINTVSGALSIASTIANAKKSIQQIQQSDSATTPTTPSPTPSSGGGGATAPSVPAPVATIGNSPVEALGDAVNQRPQPIRAYVVESEVSANQQRVSDISRRADLFP